MAAPEPDIALTDEDDDHLSSVDVGCVKNRMGGGHG
jgi:hypothetical protein